MIHKPGANNDSDIFKKNTDGATFEMHIPVYVGSDDEYLKSRAGEAVRSLSLLENARLEFE